MEIQTYVIQATDVVLARNVWDMPAEVLAEAIKDQACLMAGITPEEIWEECST